MHGENLLVNDGSNGKTIEAIGESLPELDVIPPLALVVEAIDAVDGCTFMVSAKHEKVLWVFDLVGKEKANGLERLLATIDVISEEQVVCLWWETTVFEQTEKVVVLAVDVAANLNWSAACH